MTDAHKAKKVAREVGFDPQIDAESACAIMGVKLEDLLAEMNARHRRRMVQMHAEMAKTARESGERRFIRCRDGDGGYVDLHIHPFSYHFWGQRLGYECWEDPQFIREYKRDNPAAVVKSVSDRLTIVRPGFKGLVQGKPQSRADRMTIRRQITAAA